MDSHIIPTVRPIISKSLSKNATKISKSKFTPEDDIKLINLVMSRLDRDWVWISQHMADRNPRQCRERWYNYLDPALHKGGWSPEEDQTLLEKKKEMGPHWNAIARFFPGRSGNSIRNRYLVITRKEERNNIEMNEHTEIKIPKIVPIDIEREYLDTKNKERCTINANEIMGKLDELLFPKEKIDVFYPSEQQREYVDLFL